MKTRRLFWLLWLLAALVLYFFENNTETRIVFAASVLLPCLSLVCALLSAEKLRFELLVSSSVQEGTDVLCEIKPSGSILFAFCMPTGSLQLKNMESEEESAPVHLLLDRQRTVHLRPEHSGTFLIRLTDTALEDRFGLFRLSLLCETKGKLTVFSSAKSAAAAEIGISGHSSEQSTESDPAAFSGIREYIPGDPIRRIHWKLSAKTGKILIREPEKEPDEAEYISPSAAQTGSEQRNSGNDSTLPRILPDSQSKQTHLSKFFRKAGPALLLMSLSLLFLLPQARSGAQALCNRLFTASQAVNSYAYDFFDVPADQPVTFTVILLSLAGLSWFWIILGYRNPLIVLLTAALSAGSQAYFGLSLPHWLNIPLFAVLGWLLLRGKHSLRTLLFFLSGLLLTAALVATQYPGVDPWIETRSEALRDRLTTAVDPSDTALVNDEEEPIETRHVNSRSLITGNQEADASREFRPVTQEKEQISLPQWAESIGSMIPYLLAFLGAGAVITGLVRFIRLRINTSKIKKSFLSEDRAKAICSMFSHIIHWLEFFGCGSGNLPYRDWTENLKEQMPEDYTTQFRSCVPLFEEALYSGRQPSSENVEAIRKLLRDTEKLLLSKADRAQRFRLKFTEGLM